MIKIKELILKANMIYDGKYVGRALSGESETVEVSGLPMKFVEGLPMVIDGEDRFVHNIGFERKNGDFVIKHGFATGCYIIYFADSSKDLCHNIVSKKYLVIMEDMVAAILYY